MTDQEPISCPIYPLEAFEACPEEDLDGLVAGLSAGKSGSFERGTVTADGRLDLCKQALGPIGTQRIVRALAERDDIHTLLLGTDGLGDAGAEAVAGLVATQDHVETVYLGCNGITADGVDTLGQSLAGHPGLRGLWLKRNPIRTEGARVLAAHLAKGSQIEVLDLVHTGIGVDGLAAIAEGIVTGGVPLSHLFLGGNAFTKDVVPVLIDLLKRCRSLRHVSLQSNFLGTEGVLRLAAPSVFRRLRSIGLGSNGVTGEGIAQAAAATGKELEQFDVGRAASETALRAHPNLIDDASTRALIDSLRQRPQLQYLSLAGCSMSATSCDMALDLVLHHPRITDLRIHGNELTAHHRAILSAWRSRKHEPTAHPLIARVRSVYR